MIAKKPWLILGSLCLLAGLIVYLYSGSRSAPHPSDRTEPQAAASSAALSDVLTVETVHPKALKDALTLRLEGRVIAQRKQTVSAQTEGRITQVKVLAGDTVTAGQILLQLENPAQQIDLAALAQQQSLNLAILANLKQKHQDYQEMLKIGLVARHDVQTVENEFRTKQVEQQGLAQQMAHARLRQARTTVTTSQAGYVLDIASEGSYVTLGQTVATLVSSQDQYIEAFVPLDQLASIQPGTLATLSVGKISKTARVVRMTPESQSGLVKLLLQADTILPLEFRPQLALKLKSVSGWLIPKRAVVLADGVPVFYRLRDHKAYPLKAGIIRDLDTQVLVSNSLLPKDEIVSAQAEMLHEGMTVSTHE